MNADSPIAARIIFWPVDRESVWLKAEFTPERLAQRCRDGVCPLLAFLSDLGGCPVNSKVTCKGVTAKDWIRFLSVGAPIGGSDEKR